MGSVAAIALSLATPGAGHAFLGRPRRGAVFFVALFAAIATIPVTRLVGLVAACVVSVAAALDVAFLRRGEHRSDLNWLIFVGAAFLGLFLVKIFYVEAFKIPSGGMLPTLQINDHLFVAKWRTSPVRGDLVVFVYPIDPKKDFIKRVVALAGDRVEVRQGTLLVNGNSAAAGDATPCSYWDYREDNGEWHQEQATCVPEALDGNHWSVAHAPQRGPRDMAEYVVPAGHVYVLGDNRENSQDSRFWGPLPVGNVKGTVLFIWWSSGPEGTRWDRIGKSP